ncbi:MAG: polyprenyl synthetase family protein [Betaproteobacteria bacterium]|nr:polyprenyl synthetase family protein [Betaproteobacteria bacterium]
MNSPHHPASLENIRRVIEADMQAVDLVIQARLRSEVVLINQIGQYIVGSGGKRLRPALVVLAGRLAGAEPRHVHELAAVIEFIHTATLLHDDVVDESSLRRGRTTANAEFGNAASVLVGDFLYSRAFQMMVSVANPRVMEVLAEATNIIAEGEVLQLLNIKDPDTNEANYLRVVRYKTAKLFQAATQVGAILGGASLRDERALADYGTHLGTSFQLIDDVLDYSGEEGETGKHLGDDLAEGKPTLPLIHAMKVGSAAQRAAVRRAILEGGREGLDEVMVAIHETGALDYARKAARAEADRAATAISHMPDSVYRSALLELCVFAVERRY